MLAIFLECHREAIVAGAECMKWETVGGKLKEDT